ncbi:MAG: radical SAM protein [Nannocystaceae bacterium]
MDLGMMFSHTCNITCRHCGIMSSPRVKTKMDLDDAKRIIREAAALRPRIGTIAFTGGEPLLFQDEHAELLSQCRSLGLRTRIVTNGFWASTIDRGLRVLGRMRDAGLCEINFSADKYHLEHMPARTLRNALECARQLGLIRVVSFVINNDHHPTDEFCSMYQVPPHDVRLYTEATVQALHDDPARTHELYDKIYLSAGHIIGLGRAAEYPEELCMRTVSTYSAGTCAEVNHRPVVYPDGTLQACCCAGGKVAAFTVGSVHDQPLHELIEQMDARTQYRFINTFGPKAMYEAVARARPEIRRSLMYGSICEICVRANDGVSAAEMDEILEQAMLEKTLEFLSTDDGARAPS